MQDLKNKIYWITTLWFLLWGGILYAQDKALRLERTIFITPTLNSENPALLQTLKEHILFKAETSFNFGKGDFVNYFKPNQYYKLSIDADSYNRLNKKTVVYGLASYSYEKGKNTGGTSFFYPYRTPFNFTPKDETTKGDNRIETYHLVGGLSYALSNKWGIGVKMNYQTISFAKLKDMRNINDILDLNFSTGISYKIANNSTIGVSYKYNRYIENMKINEYGNLDKDYYALINKGSFMGNFHLYGDDGILNTKFKRPWVDIVHHFGIQYNHNFSKNTKWFTEFIYNKGKGHYGNDSDNSVVYMKHTKKGYSLHSQLSFNKNNKTHIIALRGNYSEITNNEQLYQEVTTSAGNSITQYYGSKEIFNRQKTNANISYNLLWGNQYLNAPWQFSANYTYCNLKRKTSYYPYFRKQNIKWHNVNLGIAKALKHKTIHFFLKYAIGFTGGNGGEPIDGKYTNSSTSATTPDYLNELLYKEQDYFTANRLHSKITFRASKKYKKNTEIYTQLNVGYIKPFQVKYIKGDFFNTTLSVGLTF